MTEKYVEHVTKTTFTCRRCGLKEVTEENSNPFYFMPTLPKYWEYVGVYLLCGECKVGCHKAIHNYVNNR